jgi:hypothetical protein
MGTKQKDLVAIIKANPGCSAIIDNDGWQLYKTSRDDAPEFKDYDEELAWIEANELARDGEVIPLGEGYGSGNCYGGDILQALAKIVGIKIESV